MYAVIKTGGKQYRVSEGDEIFVEKLDVEDGTEVTFDEVLMIDGKIGTPYLDGATVKGTVLKQGKSRKSVSLSIRTSLEVIVKLKDIVNLIQKSKLLKLMVNYD